MAGTIREFLRRRTRILQATALVGWLVCAGGMLFLMPSSAGCHPRCVSRGPPWPIVVGFPIFGIAILGMLFFTRCPRCSGRLGHVIATTGGPFSKAANFCPYCGVSFDESYLESAKSPGVASRR